MLNGPATQLMSFFESYELEHQLKDSTKLTYTGAIRNFDRWFQEAYGHPCEWRHIESDVINKWIVWLQIGRSLHSVHSRKLALMALLNTARRRQLCSFETERIRKVRPPSTPKDFWTLEQVGQLIEATCQLKGRFRATQIRKDYFARAYIAFAWDTALRRGDMAILRFSAVDASLQFSHPREKTGVTDVCRINPESYMWFQQMNDDCNTPRDLAFPPWQRGRNALRPISQLFGTVMLLAGLSASDSCLKKLVRSSIFEADHLSPGTGWLQGHHSDCKTTLQAYLSRHHANMNRPVNRSLGEKG